MRYDHLFSPIKIRGLELKNRVKLPGMAVCMHDKGYVTERMITYHAAIAAGGCGLNTTEATSVHGPTAPADVLNFSDDSFLPGMAKLTEAIHAAGGKACLMLDQGGISTFFVDSDLPVFIPSDRDDFGLEGASVEFIREVVEAFAVTAARAVQAGFDAVEFHVSHGYGPHGFLSGGVNRRTDEYGGSLENRARFPLETIRAIRAAIPEEMPIFMRIAPFDDYVEGGLNAEDIIQFCRWAREAGVDALDVTRGNCWGYGTKYMIPPVDLPRGFNVPNAARLKQETGLVVVGVGRINDPGQAEGYIASDMVDMVDIGRAQLADHEFCTKARAGRADEIVRCIGCLEGCFDRCMDPDYPHISCLWNPAVGEEAEFAIQPAARAKKVLVVGGGVAGIEAAITLQKRGHRVILAEAGAMLGGVFNLAGVAPRKEEFLEAVQARAKHVYQAGVEVRLNTRADRALLDELAPEAVIFAIGGRPITIRVPGWDKPNVFGYQEILTKQARPYGRIAVIGGGLVGLETAEFLADGVNEITVVEMKSTVGGEAGATRYGFIEEALKEKDIRCIVNAKAVEIKDKALVVDIKGELQEIPCAYVVMAVGSAAAELGELLDYCAAQGIDAHVVGDAKRPGVAIDAIADAAVLAREI